MTQYLPSTDFSRSYSLFGEVLLSDSQFQNRLGTSAEKPTLTFSAPSSEILSSDWKKSQPLYQSNILLDDGQPLVRFYEIEMYHVMSFTRVANFYLGRDKIVYEILDEKYSFMVEIHFLGIVLSIWLELQGIPALHASAVVIGDGAVAFLASNTGGKSSLAAILVQAAFPLLTDDILPIEIEERGVVGRPGYPQMRMWPDLAEYFTGTISGLEKVHPFLDKLRVPIGADGFGSFHDARHPIRCIYIPDMTSDAGNSAVSITAIPQSEAVFELARNSFAVHILDSLGDSGSRFSKLAAVARSIPMRRITYPKGFEHLPRVRESILSDQKNL